MLQMALAAALYERAPHPVKQTLAGLRGRRLRRLRYPAGSEALTQAALARDAFDAGQWERWQQRRLGFVLDRAARLVPHYRELWAAQGVAPGESGIPASLEQWPTLSKEFVRHDPRSFVADDRPRRRLHTVGTSGTSGTPLVVYRSRDDAARHYAIYEARVRRWNGVSRHDRWVMAGGQLVVPFEQERPPFWVESRPLHQLYLSTNHLKREFASAYAKELRRFAPTHIVGYPSSLTVLARLALEQELELPQPKVLISNAEPLTERQRSLLREAFGCETRDTYGMGEGAAAAAECECGSLHISPENGVVEILDTDDRPLPPGTVGEVVVTGLVNESMILVRYRTGDRGVLSAEPCGCGRAAPVLSRIEGRTSDMVLTPDGRQVFWFNPAFAGLPVHEAQIVQVSLDLLEVRLVPLDGWDADHERELGRRLGQRVGDMTISVSVVDAIERGPNGKFRPVVSLVARE